MKTNEILLKIINGINVNVANINDHLVLMTNDDPVLNVMWH